METNTVDLTKRTKWEIYELPEFLKDKSDFEYVQIIDDNPDNEKWIANVQKKEDAEKICKAVNNYDRLLEHLRAVTYEYEVAIKLLAEAASFDFNPNQNNLILNSKAAIKKAEQ